MSAGPELAVAATKTYIASLVALAAVVAGWSGVTARGPGLGIANEATLKLKETCLMPAEAFSVAELIHGPLALSGPAFKAKGRMAGTMATVPVHLVLDDNTALRGCLEWQKTI